MKNILFDDESVKGRITDLISENLTDLDLESRMFFVLFTKKKRQTVDFDIHFFQASRWW